jgi:predicted nucleic acid-binding Zn ribbon protein
MATTSLDPIREIRSRERRDKLKMLAWVLALVAVLMVLRILIGHGCGC